MLGNNPKERRITISRNKVGILLAISAGVLWGFLGIFVRELSSAGFSPMQLTCLRYIIVAIVLFIYLVIRDRDQFRVTPKALVFLLFLGILGNALNSTSYFNAMERISLSLSTILQYFAPFLVLVLSVPLFGEVLTRTKLFAVFTAFFGCVLCTGLLTDPGSMDFLGIAFGIGSACFFGFYTLGSKKAKNDGYSVVTVLFYAAIGAAVFLLPICDAPNAASLTFASFNNLALVLGLGIVMTLLPFGIYNMAIERTEVGIISIVTYIEPVVSTVVGLVCYGEEITIGIAAGIILVLVALIIVNRTDISVHRE